jgi:hypothetical protein
MTPLLASRRATATAAQSAPITLGLNAGGIVTSNGLGMRVGL